MDTQIESIIEQLRSTDEDVLLDGLLCANEFMDAHLRPDKRKDALLEELVRLLERSSAKTSATALWTIGKFNEKRAIPFLCQPLARKELFEDPNVIMQFLFAYENLAGKQIYPQYEELFKRIKALSNLEEQSEDMLQQMSGKA